MRCIRVDGDKLYMLNSEYIKLFRKLSRNGSWCKFIEVDTILHDTYGKKYLFLRLDDGHIGKLCWDEDCNWYRFDGVL